MQATGLNNARVDLAACFGAAAQALRAERETLNRLDTVNGNHGDHMLAIFELAESAAVQRPQAGLAEAMAYAGELLAGLTGNGSAQTYGRGLTLFSRQFERYGISLQDLASFSQAALREEESSEAPPGARPPSTSDVLKALAAGLAAWQQVEQGQAPPENPLGLGVLFDLGVAYLQAKQRGGSKAEIIAGAAASASPLDNLPYRRQSANIALKAFLQALAA